MSPTSKKKANKPSKEVKNKPTEAQDMLGSLLDAVGVEDGAQILGSKGLNLKIKGVISTQSATLDAAIGRGGIPMGRLTVIHGPEGCGKTTLCGHLVAETQRIGGVGVYYDNEYKLDPEYFSKLGVDINKLIVSQPSYLEKFFKSVDSVIDKVKELREKQGKRIPVMIILDSMNASIAKSEYDGDFGDHHYAPQARVFSTSLPKIIPRVSQEDIALVFISQIRTNIGIQFGDSDSTAGGKAPKFYASLMLKMRKSKTLNEDGEKVGNEVTVTCSKNQISVPFKKATMRIIYGVGIDKKRALFDQAQADGIILKKGSFYSWRGEQLGQGADNAIETLEENDWLEPLEAELAEKNEWERVTNGEV